MLYIHGGNQVGTTSVNTIPNFVKFEVLTAVVMKSTACWSRMPHSLLISNLHFRGTYCRHLQRWIPA
jgi:hypothetical protein